jgi:hypothetical protein
LLLAAAIASRCIGGSPTGPVPAHTPPPPTITGLTITGAGGGNPGQTAQLAANASFSDGSSQIVTTQAVWTSTNASIATVSPAGVITFVAIGESDIRATYASMSANARVTVVAAPLPRHNLTGVVTDADRRGVGLAGARVEVTDGPDAGRATTTAADGSYTLTNLTEGTFTLRISLRDYDTLVQTVRLTSATRLDVTLRPLINVTANLGTFTVQFRVLAQNCETPIVPGPTGQLTLAANSDGRNLTVTITERTTTRVYSGTMSGDGSFNATGSGVILGFSPSPDSHDFVGSVQGRATGSTISGSENLTYGAPCPGKTMQVSFTGSR